MKGVIDTISPAVKPVLHSQLLNLFSIVQPGQSGSRALFQSYRIIKAVASQEWVLFGPTKLRMRCTVPY